MTVHRPAIQRQPAIHVPGAGWAFAVIVGIILVTASLLLAFPPRAVDTGTTGPEAAAYRIRAERADLEPYVVTPVARPASIVSYPSGFTATYSPVKGTGLVSHPSGFTATYSPLASMARIIGYPSGFTATYNPLNVIVIP